MKNCAFPKNLRLLSLTAIAGGIAAFVLRLLQNKTGFEAATGLAVPGNAAGTLLVVWLVVLAALLALLSWRLSRTEASAPVFPADFTARDSRLLMLPIAGSLLMALAGLADLYEGLGMGRLLVQLKAAADPYASAVTEVSGFSEKLQLILGLLSLASAAILLLSAVSCSSKQPARPAQNTALLFPPVALVLRLVLTYRLDSVDPVLSAYYVELLALVFLTLGFYRLSSFAFQAGRVPSFCFYTCAAVVLCFAALADGGEHLSSLLLYAGGAVTLLGFLWLYADHSAAAGGDAAVSD